MLDEEDTLLTILEDFDDSFCLFVPDETISLSRRPSVFLVSCFRSVLTETP